MGVPSSSPRAVLLSLYREVLRVHRSLLPPTMRALGDRTVRAEWRQMRTAATSEAQWRAFVAEWQQYVLMLRGSGGSAPGSSGDLEEDVVATLSAEQRAQLDRLKGEAIRLGSALPFPVEEPGRR